MYTDREGVIINVWKLDLTEPANQWLQSQAPLATLRLW